MTFNEAKGLKILHQIATALATWPPYLRSTKSRVFKIYKIYALALVLIYSYINCIILVEHIGTYFEHFGSVANGVVRFIHYLIVFASFVESTLSSINVADDFNGMTIMLKKVDTALHEFHEKGNTSFNFYSNFALVNAFMFTLLCTIVVIFNNRHSSPLRLSLYFQYYRLAVGAVLCYSYTRVITRKFEILNSMLKDSEKDKTGVESIRLLYSYLSRVVRIYNKVFGWRIFFQFAVVFIGCIQLANMVAVQVFAYGGVDGALKSEGTEKLELILTMLVRCIFFFVSIYLACNFALHERFSLTALSSMEKYNAFTH